MPNLIGGSIAPLLGFTVGVAAAVEQASQVAFQASVDDDPRRVLHHVEVVDAHAGLLLDPPLLLRNADQLPCCTPIFKL